MFDRKGQMYLVVLFIGFFVICGVMFYLLVLSPDSPDIAHLGSVGSGVIEVEDSIDLLFVSLDQGVDLAVSLALVELGNNGGVDPSKCKESLRNIWSRCEPSDNIVLSEFEIIFEKYWKEILSKTDSKFDLRILKDDLKVDFNLDNKIIVNGVISVEVSGDYGRGQVSIQKERVINKEYDYDLGIYNKLYERFKSDTGVVCSESSDCKLDRDNMDLQFETSFRIVKPVIRGTIIRSKNLAISNLVVQ